MHRIIAGGTGLIGKHLVEHWLMQNHRVSVIGRSEERIQQLFGTRVQAISWDHLTQDLFESAEVVVNLTGASVGEKRWNKKRKDIIVNSRIGSTKKIANLLAKLQSRAPLLLNASAIGVYGLQQTLPEGLPPRVDENSSLTPSPTDFLSFVARRWEEAAEADVAAGGRVIFLRFGVVLAKEGGALPQLLKPYHYYLGGPIGTGRQPFSWVAIDDVIHAIDFLIASPDATGPYNIVAPECVTQRTLAQTIGRVMNRPALLPMPGWLIQLMLGKEMAQELLLEGQHVYPARLLQKGFQFSYPDLESALNHVLTH